MLVNCLVCEMPPTNMEISYQNHWHVTSIDKQISQGVLKKCKVNLEQIYWEMSFLNHYNVSIKGNIAFFVVTDQGNQDLGISLIFSKKGYIPDQKQGYRSGDSYCTHESHF